MIALAKTITISEEAYDRLAESKKRGESFTEVILREVTPRSKPRDITDLAGTWEGDEEEYQKIVTHLAERRSMPPRKVEM
jgi:predicted CopG family antitoxin